MASFREILASIVAVGLVGVLVYPIFIQPNPYNGDRSAFSYVHIATAVLIYTGDHDEIFPPATSEPTLRVLIYPYIKSSYVFEPGRKSGATRFNFNLAGLSTDAPPYPGTYSISPDKIVLTYARNLEKRDEYFVYFLADERGTLTVSQLLKALEPQFDRKGVKLFPSDYLADQDPLKDIK